MKENILFVSHYKTQCGVYEFGDDIYKALSVSQRYNFIKLEVQSLQELKDGIKKYTPVAVIYNFHPAVMPWLYEKKIKGFYTNNIYGFKILQLGIIHEVTEAIADCAVGRKRNILTTDAHAILNSFFDFYIAPDPTLRSTSEFIYKTGRLVPSYKSETDQIITSKPVIGSFGFATPNKGFEDLIKRVQEEFDEAHIRFNMPFAEFGDKDGSNARLISEKCKALITKTGISIEISHDFLGKTEVLDFLSKNTLNAFFYQDKTGRGISSAVDLAMAVKKPIAVTECPMFRHILTTEPSISVDKLPLKEIIANGFTPLQKLADDWSEDNIRSRYEFILDDTLTGYSKNSHGIFKKLQSLFSGKQVSVK